MTHSKQSKNRFATVSRSGVLALVTCLLVATVTYGVFLQRGVAPAVIGYNLVAAERVLLGGVPYRDFLYNYTPGVPWLNAWLFDWAGTTLLVARVGVLVAKVATVLLLYLIARRYLGSWPGLLPVALTLAWIGYGDVLKVFPTQYGMAFLLGACLAVLIALQASKAPQRTLWLIVAGLLCGLVFVFKQNVGLFAAAATALSVTTVAKDRDDQRVIRLCGTRLLPVAAGFLAIVGLMAAKLASDSALEPMIAHFIRHGSVYAEAKGTALPGVVWLLPVCALLGVVWAAGRVARVGFAKSAGLYAAGFLLLAAAAVADRGPLTVFYRSLMALVYYLPFWLGVVFLWRAVRKSPSEPLAAGAPSPAPLVYFSVLAFMEIFPRSDADHLIRALPPSLLLFSILVWGGVVGAGGRRRILPRVLLPCLIVLVLGVRVTWAPQFDGLGWTESYALEFTRGRGVCGAPGEAVRLNRVVAYVESRTGPGEPILSLSRKMTSVYFLANRPNTTRLLWYDSAGIPEEERRAIEERIRKREFKLILVGGDMSVEVQAVGSDDVFSGAMQRISEGYEVALVIDGVSVLQPRVERSGASGQNSGLRARL